MKRLFSLGKARKKRLASLARLIIINTHGLFRVHFLLVYEVVQYNQHTWVILPPSGRRFPSPRRAAHDQGIVHTNYRFHNPSCRGTHDVL